MAIWELVMCILMNAINRATAAPGSRSIRVSNLNNLGSCLILTGATNAVVTISLLTNLPKHIFDRHYYLHAMFVLVISVGFVSGLVGVVTGLFLLENSNPGRRRYRVLAVVILCVCSVAAPCAVGIVAVAYFSSFLMMVNWACCYAKYSDKGHDHDEL